MHVSGTTEEYECLRMQQEAKERAWAEEVSNVEGAKTVLATYVEALDRRFLNGGTFDTRCIPSGDAFVELTCGGVFTGRKLCECYTPMVAVRVFIDTIEHYIAPSLSIFRAGRQPTLYWRVHPELRGVTETWERYDVDALRQVKRTTTFYNIRARLLIL